MAQTLSHLVKPSVLKIKLLTVIIAVLTAFQGLSQVQNEMESTLNVYQKENFSERVYLHTDKSKVIPGETLWYSAYLVQGPFNSFSNQSKVLHVDLINVHNEIIVSKTHKIEGGLSAGAITFPTNAPEGYYMLRAYTNWMRNFDDRLFFSEKIEVVLTSYEEPPTNQKQDVNISFFPEGGQLVNGLLGRVAFKISDSDGKGISEDLEGRIIDSKGNTVTFFKALYKGMGTFFLDPKKEELYKAILPDGSVFPLPASVDQGISMMAITDENDIKLTVNASSDYKGKEVHLIGTLGNRFVFNNTYAIDDGRIEFEIPKSNLPKGMLTLSLLDASMNPRCTRQVFIQNEQSLNFKTTFKKEGEDKMILEVRVTDKDGNPVSANFSIAVTDSDFTDKSKSERNLASHLLIESRSLQPIENSVPFVMSDDRTSILKADLLMLTHTFKSTDWSEVLNPTNSNKEYDIAKGLTISGTARWEDGIPLRNKQFKAMVFDEKLMSQFSTSTDEKGRFSIYNFDEEGTVNVIFSTYDKKGKLIPSRITLDESESELPIPDYKFQEAIKEMISENASSEQTFSEEQTSYAMFDEDATFLEEVTVVGKKIEEDRAPSVLGVNPSATRYLEENKIDQRDYLQVLNTIAGVQYTGRGPTANVTIRGPVNFGASSPLWILDGVIITPDPNPGNSNVPEFIANLNPNSIDRIEVAKGAEASIFGSRGGAGAILIYTKQGGSAYESKTTNLEVNGHSAPKYFDPINSSSTNRFTLYWNPRIQTDENGMATISFYNNVNAEDIQVDIQGLSTRGLIGVYLESIKVE